MVPFLPYYWTVWKFSPNKQAAKSLLTYLLQEKQVERLIEACSGYDIPPYRKLDTFNIWSEVEPPKGTIYSCPRRYDDEVTSIAMAPAPPNIAVQMYTQATNTKIIAQCTQQRKSIDQAEFRPSSPPGGIKVAEQVRRPGKPGILVTVPHRNRYLKRASCARSGANRADRR